MTCFMDQHAQLNYPPTITTAQLHHLTTEIKDYQLIHGSLLKHAPTETLHTATATSIGVSIFPSVFPEARFREAQELVPVFGKLYASVAADDEFLHDALKEVIRTDEFVAKLWKIHLTAKNKKAPGQTTFLGLFRSDYMLKCSDDNSAWDMASTSLAQVEFQTIATAGIAHGMRVGQMHEHLRRKRAYERAGCAELPPAPANHALEGFVNALQKAHASYGSPHSSSAKQTCVLMVVESPNVNIADERPIEYALWDRDPPVPSYRVTFGEEFLSRTSLNPDQALLYTPPAAAATLTPPLEVAVVYLRSGINAHEYTDAGVSARLRMESSRAIQCPSVAGHLAGLKAVQQKLTRPEVLAQYLDAAEVEKVRRVLVPMFPLDASHEGKVARGIVADATRVSDYVLKPCREGGGNNVFGDDIPDHLARVPRENWSEYILMKLIEPPVARNYLMTHRELYEGFVVSELGVCNTVLWQKSSEGGLELLSNEYVGWTLKTKSADSNELSVVKGYGCFDSMVTI